MEPIVYGIRKTYARCMKLERVNFHEWSEWHELLLPVAAPQFDLLDSSNQILHRWVGLTAKEEFTSVLDSLCG